MHILALLKCHFVVRSVSAIHRSDPSEYGKVKYSKYRQVISNEEQNLVRENEISGRERGEEL